MPYILHTLCAVIAFGIGYYMQQLFEPALLDEQQRTHRFIRLICNGDTDQLRVLIDSLSANEFRTLLRTEYVPDDDFPQTDDADLYDDDRLTPLAIAVYHGQAAAAALLLEKGADVHQKSSWTSIDHTTNCTPLLVAAEFGHFNVCRVLITNGAVVDLGTDNGYTPLMLACSVHGGLEIVRFLLANGARTELMDDTGTDFALLDAAERGNLDVCTALVAAGADVNQATVDGYTALMEAAGRDYLGIVALLVEHGANIDHADTNGHTALMYAWDNDRTDVVQHLLTAGASTDPGDQFTLLDAAGRGHLVVCILLLISGEDVNQADVNGHTALMDASFYGQLDIVRMLLRHGAQTGTMENTGNRFALLSAAGLGYLDVCRVLVESGADVNQATVNGNTALMDACRTGHLQIVDLLIQHGAHIGHTDNEGRTAMDLAAEREDEELMNILHAAAEL